MAYAPGGDPNAVHELANQVQISGFDADDRELVQEASPVEIRHSSCGLLDLFDESLGSRKVSACLFDECSHGERRNLALLRSRPWGLRDRGAARPAESRPLRVLFTALGTGRHPQSLRRREGGA